MLNTENLSTDKSEIVRLQSLLRQKENENKQLHTIIFGQQNEIKLLKEEVSIDPLTELYRRKPFEKRVNEEYSKIRKSKEERRNEGGIEHITIFFVDIDDFKRYNSEGGEKKGDQMLQAIAHLLKDNVRESDIVARWGGEEMVVALIGANEERAMEKAEELRAVIEKKSECTVSIGVASLRQDITPLESIHQANIAMIKAKATGKNRVELYSQFTQEEYTKYEKTST